MSLLQARWEDGGENLVVVEPTDAEVRTHAAQLSAWLNESHNSRMMGNTQPMSADDVRQHYAEMRADGARPLLLLLNDQLVGDADLRNVTPPVAEFAIMVGPRGSQSRGLGTRFSVMVHALAFEVLRLETVYLSIVPDNEAARRCYLKVGYGVDFSEAARRFVDDETDVAMSLTRTGFLREHRAAVAKMTLGTRD